MTHFHTVLPLLFPFLMICACVTQTDPPCNDEGQTGSTINLLLNWSAARVSYSFCHSQAEIDKQFCEESDCEEVYEEAVFVCLYDYFSRINKAIPEWCSARIFDTEEWMPVASDTDGDGVSNWHEHWIGLNPCYAYSFGCQAQADAERDFDEDGLSNGADPDPVHPATPEPILTEEPDYCHQPIKPEATKKPECL